jgi:hypothetical protein
MHKEQDLMEAKNSLPIVGRDMGASGEDVNSAVTHDEKKDQFTSSTSSNVDLEGMSSEEAAEFEKKTLSRIDWRMLPLLGAMYAVCLIDRTNTGIARTAGMERDLGLKHGSRYSIILVVYFIPYILMQLPSNLMLRYLGVRTWIFFLVVAWGAAELGMGFVKSWQALAALRALLGLFEAGYFPAMAFVITTWSVSNLVFCALCFVDAGIHLWASQRAKLVGANLSVLDRTFAQTGDTSHRVDL